MASSNAVKFTPAQQQRYRQIGQIAAFGDAELGPILRSWQERLIRTSIGADGNTYKIRDVWSYEGGLVTCQYAVKQPDGRTAWFDCREGVEFSEIEPYEPATSSKKQNMLAVQAKEEEFHRMIMQGTGLNG